MFGLLGIGDTVGANRPGDGRLHGPTAVGTGRVCGEVGSHTGCCEAGDRGWCLIRLSLPYLTGDCLVGAQCLVDGLLLGSSAGLGLLLWVSTAISRLLVDRCVHEAVPVSRVRENAQPVTVYGGHLDGLWGVFRVVATEFEGHRQHGGSVVPCRERV
ncbi:MAG: hypothetical protein ACI9HI_002401 [Salinirussus sp.]